MVSIQQTPNPENNPHVQTKKVRHEQTQKNIDKSVFNQATETSAHTNGTKTTSSTGNSGISITVNGDCNDCDFTVINGNDNQVSKGDNSPNINGSNNNVSVVNGDNNHIKQTLYTEKEQAHISQMVKDYGLTKEEAEAVIQAEQEVQNESNNMRTNIGSEGSNIHKLEANPPADLDVLLQRESFLALDKDTQKLLLTKIKYPNSIEQLLSSGFKENISFDAETNNIVATNHTGYKMSLDVGDDTFLKNIQINNVTQHKKDGDQKSVALYNKLFINGAKCSLTLMDESKEFEGLKLPTKVIIGSNAHLKEVIVDKPLTSNDSIDFVRVPKKYTLSSQKEKLVQNIKIKTTNPDYLKNSDGFYYFLGTQRYKSEFKPKDGDTLRIDGDRCRIQHKENGSSSTPLGFKWVNEEYMKNLRDDGIT